MKKRRKAPTLAKLKAKAWKLLSLVIRKEAAAKNQLGIIWCYTCPALGTQAGHAIGGRGGAVLLDEEIIRPQCVRCNIMLSGNYGVFATKLIREKSTNGGQHPAGESDLREALDWWESKLAASRQVRKWTRSELEEKIESYKARLEALQSQG